MMIDTIREPETLQIDLHRTKLVRIVSDRQVTINNLQHLSDTEIVFPILIKCDISSRQRGFRQVIDEHFLSQGQLVKAIQPISEQLQISEPLTLI